MIARRTAPNGQALTEYEIRNALSVMDPAKINSDEWRGREEDGILYVPKAGEILYQLKS